MQRFTSVGRGRSKGGTNIGSARRQASRSDTAHPASDHNPAKFCGGLSSLHGIGAMLGSPPIDRLPAPCVFPRRRTPRCSWRHS